MNDIKVYSAIFNHMQLGLFVYELEDQSDDRSLKMIAVNKAAARLVGLESDKMIGRKIDEVFPKLRDDDMPNIFRNVILTNKAKSITEYEYEDDNLIKKAWAFKVFPIQNNCVGVAFEDVTEDLKQDEEVHKQAVLIGNVPDAVISTDLDLNIKSWNKAAEKIYGWTKEEALGRKVQEILILSPDQNRFGEAVKAIKENGSWDGEVANKGKDGEHKYIFVSCSLLFDRKGKPSGIIAVNRDVTDKKAMEDKLLEAYKYLGIMNRKNNILLNMGKKADSKNKEEVLKLIIESIEKISHGKMHILFKYNQGGKLEVLNSCSLDENDLEKILDLEFESYDECFKKLLASGKRVVKQISSCKLGDLELGNVNKEDYVIILPLIKDKRIIGVLLIIVERMGEVTTQELDFYDILASQVASILKESAIC